MAKKTVASLQTSSKRLSKAIKMVKSPKSGAYTFVESIMDPADVDAFLADK
jgi:methyl coenzyme M reductase beta subunit